jgi:hypothetical protein
MFGHTTPHCPQLQHRGYGQQPNANLALRNLSSTGNADGFLDTGANQHVTSDLATLAASEPYLSVARQKIRAASAGDFIFVMFGLLEFGSLESPPSNSLRATRKPDVLVLSEICG